MSTPLSIGIIMDGNRRWARARGETHVEGHRAGFEKLKEVVGWCHESGIEHLAVYALSTENWQRPKEEVSFLLDLFRTLLRGEVGKVQKEGVAVHFVGVLERFPDDIQSGIAACEEENPREPQGHLWVCASYGGRAEIVAAANKLCENGQEITEETFADAIFTRGMPDPDIIIRPGGEKRLSNFLTWQSVYSELFFLDTHWPDFSKEEFEGILSDYASRQRRRGT